VVPFQIHGSKYYLYGSKEFFPYIIEILKAAFKNIVKKCSENIMKQEAPSTLFLTSKVNTYTDNAKYNKNDHKERKLLKGWIAFISAFS
jgi:hypothetical protein